MFKVGDIIMLTDDYHNKFDMPKDKFDFYRRARFKITYIDHNPDISWPIRCRMIDNGVDEVMTEVWFFAFPEIELAYLDDLLSMAYTSKVPEQNWFSKLISKIKEKLNG